MLQMRPNCELCDNDLGPGASNALICSFECTFCQDCAKTRLAHTCPNCGGDLVRRPTRKEALLNDFPVSKERVHAKT